jgi:raffinose/stachyose/melibiose transport system substrate-binding protein
MKSRRTLATLVAAASVVALSACSGGGAGAGGGGSTTLTFFSWDNEETMAPLIDKFEKENEDITIKFSNAPPVAEYISTLQTRVLSGTAADVFLIAAENKTNLIENKAVLDLTDEPFMENLAEFNKGTYSADGKDYGMSTSSWGAGIVYNKDLLAEVGAEAPPQTWDEFLALSKKLKDAGITPYLESVQAMPTTLAALLGAENALASKPIDEAIFDDGDSFADSWVEPLTSWSQLWEQGLVTRDVVGLSGDQVRDEFTNGRVAMISTGPWDMVPIREAAPDLQFAMVPVPGLKDGQPFLAGAASPGYAINSKSKNVKAAEKFLTFLGDADTIEMYNKATSAITTTTDFEPVIDPALEDIVQPVRDGDIYLPQIAWKRHENILNEEATAQLQLLVLGQATPQQVAKALDQKLKDSDG